MPDVDDSPADGPILPHLSSTGETSGSIAGASWHVRGGVAEVELAAGTTTDLTTKADLTTTDTTDTATTDVDGLARGVAELIAGFEASGIDVHLAADHPTHELDALPELLADRVGLTERRDLLQMRRPLPVGPDHVARSQAPTVSTRAFIPGTDEAAWIRVNNRAFAGHPDQGQEDRSTLASRMAEPWFDPNGFLVADEADEASRSTTTGGSEVSPSLDEKRVSGETPVGDVPEGAAGEMSGFCWTKVHPEVPGGDEALGEIYVIGVDPRHRGEGLGPAFVLAGLDHMAGRGIGTAVLYVDATNEPARRLYDRLGFTVHQRRRVYTRPLGSGDEVTTDEVTGDDVTRGAGDDAT